MLYLSAQQLYPAVLSTETTGLELTEMSHFWLQHRMAIHDQLTESQKCTLWARKSIDS